MASERNHRFDCAYCGKQRIKTDILAGTYDVYLKLGNAKTLIRIGLCKDCFDKKNTYQKNVILQRYVDFEKKILGEEPSPFKQEYLNNIKKEDCKAVCGYKKYWVDLTSKHGQNPEKKLAGKQFYDEVQE